MADPASTPRAWHTQPNTRPLSGALRIPGDKSVSHRAVMFAALAHGTSHVKGFLEAEDTRATARVMQQLGVDISTPAYGERAIQGVGLKGLHASELPLDCGNSGTAMRLLSGVLSGQAFASTLIGDDSLSTRPMQRVAQPLREMGAEIQLSATGTSPIQIRPAQQLRGIRYEGQVASAQVKSALLLAGLYAEGETEVIEVAPTRDYTETMLAAMGADIALKPGYARIRGGVPLKATNVDVPGDFSSAAFSLVAALLVPGSHVRLQAVGMHPRRTGLLDVLRMMGANIEVVPVSGGGECCDIEIHASTLRGIDVPEVHVPDMIDEFPILFVAAACAKGITRVRGAAELRVKESDRIAKMAEGLRTLGIRVDETEDGADIHGGTLHAGVVHSGGDHRIAMAFAVAGLVASAPLKICDVANVETSYPGFASAMASLGADIASA